MTRLLHTADLHLARERTERWDAFDAVLDAAAERDVDALLVTGDLLDRGEDHAALRAEVRGRFDRLDAPVYLLPGNHDREAYASGQDWGRRVTLLAREPVHAVELHGLRLIGLPFPREPGSFRGLRERVAERTADAGAHVLAAHGTLIDAGARHVQAESQEEEPGPYFPVRSGDLRGLDLEYVALGHYHQHEVWDVGGTPVAYPGSPSPIGPHALGPRSAVVAEVTEGGADLERVLLPVPYRRRLTRWITPFHEHEDLQAVEEELEELADDRCELTVVLEGILAEVEEEQLRRETDELQERFGARFGGLEFDLRGVGLDPARADLFREFRRRLERELDGADPGEEFGTAELRQRALELAARALKS